MAAIGTASTVEAPTEAPLELSVVIPCLNEAEAIAIVIEKARRTMADEGIVGEVVVADNGSDDGSPELAAAAGARVVHEVRKGYGSAYLAGFAAARGRYILMGDGDDTYDFTEIARFVDPLRGGADMVIGNRMSGIQPGAMPWLHRRIGNPLLTGLLNLFFRSGVTDAHCGMRAFRRDVLPTLDLRSTGMEFASEQVIRASKSGLDIREVEIDYHPRKGDSKLASFSDGWRHLRFLLIHSPTWLFVVPGALFAIAGLIGSLITLTGVELFGREWQLHAMIASVAAVIIGAQILQIGVFSKAFAYYYLGERDRLIAAMRSRVRLEHGLLAGLGLLGIGLVIAGVVLGLWIDRGLGELREERLAMVGLMLIVVGLQTIFGAFFLSILGLRRRPHTGDPDAG
ncbi:MAG: glycosyltransferase [Solirubrobacterales bacterium]|nr:glycosyltransferase [Solirubrobacterales bacterium]